MTQLTKVQYIESIQVVDGNTVIAIENSAEIIVNGIITFDSGIANTTGTVIQGLSDPNNISDPN